MITIPALALRLLSLGAITITGNSNTIHNGNTMSRGSSWSARRRAGGREILQATKWPKQCGRRKASLLISDAQRLMSTVLSALSK